MITPELQELAAKLGVRLSLDEALLIIAAIEVAQERWTDADTVKFGTPIANRITETD